MLIRQLTHSCVIKVARNDATTFSIGNGTKFSNSDVCLLLIFHYLEYRDVSTASQTQKIIYGYQTSEMKYNVKEKYIEEQILVFSDTRVNDKRSFQCQNYIINLFNE
jgi:hypothetical protein